MVWESRDLVNWSPQRSAQVSPPAAGNTWAPEAYWDSKRGVYVVFWVSKLYAANDPGHTGSSYNRMMYGFLIINSKVTSTAPPGTFFLGRPWHPGGDPAAVAQVVIRNTSLPAAVKPAPWSDMSGFSWRDARLREYHNTGPGAGNGPDRPQLTDGEADQYTVKKYLGDWNPCCRG
jgi:pectin methylesterase-like acyl-CoA thioesterase